MLAPMTAIVLDTLELTTKLKAGGFTEQQAETQARVIAELVEKQLATRSEVEQHDTDLKRDICESENRLQAHLRELELKVEAVKAELKRDIESSRSELIKWVVGVVFGVGLLQLTIITSLLLKLSHQL